MSNRFILLLSGFSVSLFVLMVILFETVLAEHFTPLVYIIIPYFALLTLAGRAVIVNTNMNKTNGFNSRFFAVRWGKVLLHMAFLIICLLNNKESIFAFTITFMVCYVFYSIFDIYSLGIYLKRKR